jgi:hypothetical protein
MSTSVTIEGNVITVSTPRHDQEFLILESTDKHGVHLAIDKSQAVSLLEILTNKIGKSLDYADLINQ